MKNKIMVSALLLTLQASVVDAGAGFYNCS